MAINPNIAMGYRGVELQNPLNALAQVSQIQGAQQANKLGQMQMAEYERTRNEEEGLRNFLSGADLTATETRNALMAKYGKSGREFAKGLTELDKARTEESARKAKLAIDKTSMYRDAVVNITNPADAIEFMKLQANDPDMMGTPITRMPLMKVLSSIPQDPVGFENWKKQTALGMTKYVEQNKPQYFQQDLGGTKQIVGIPGLGGAASTVAGSTQSVTMTPAQVREAADSATRIKQEGQRIGLEGRRVAVMEENARRDKDPVFQQTMANAKATGEAIAKNDVAAKQALPKIISDAQLALNVVDQMVGKQEVRDANGKIIEAGTKPHPGFQDAVGATWKPGARFVPGTNAASYQALQDQVEGTAFLSAFEALKGGGAISEKEGEKATAARLRMRLAQDEKEYIKAAREFQDIVRTGVQNAQRKAGGGAAAGGANVDALLEKYK
jgi:hypothetical protein